MKSLPLMVGLTVQEGIEVYSSYLAIRQQLVTHPITQIYG